jgi:hypothetical protein
MAGNESLSARNRTPADEFYTSLTDIEAELRHYRDQFRGKVVLCNCDDPYESNFFKFFAMNFNHLGIKKLITTCYAVAHYGRAVASIGSCWPAKRKAP